MDVLLFRKVVDTLQAYESSALPGIAVRPAETAVRPEYLGARVNLRRWITVRMAPAISPLQGCKSLKKLGVTSELSDRPLLAGLGQPSGSVAMVDVLRELTTEVIKLIKALMQLLSLGFQRKQR